MTSPVYMVATDSFMSGWGGAPGRSIVAVECHTSEEVDFAEAKLRERPEMKRVRFCYRKPRLRDGDHLKIFTRADAPFWFPPAP